jgi:hypothetical protein
MAAFGVHAHVGTTASPKSKTIALHVPSKNKDKSTNKHKKRKNHKDCNNKTMRQIEANDSDLPLSNNAFIPCHRQAVYLGQIISCDLKDDYHLRTRISKATQIFGALKQRLLGNNQVWRQVKRVVFEAMILPTLLDGIESCVVSQRLMDELTSAFHRMVRGALRITPYTQRKYKLTSETLLGRLGLHPLHYYVDLKVLGYAGHVERMDKTRMPKRIRDGQLLGPRKVGGQFKNHKSFVQ